MQKIKKTILLLTLALLLTGVVAHSDAVYAANKTSSDCISGKVDPQDKTKCLPVIGDGCANYDSSTAAGKNNCLKNNSIIQYLKIAINTLSAAVGVIVTAMIILGGIQYSLARDNASAVTEAKKRITNAIIALVLFMFIFAFLQWLIPGGVFNNS
jgi:hypothetical protein